MTDSGANLHCHLSTLFNPSYPTKFFPKLIALLIAVLYPQRIMISASLAILALAACSAVNGQDNAVQIEAIEAHFAGAGIVPSLLTAFEPSAVLTINYNGANTG